MRNGAYQIMPPLTAAEYAALKADIAEHGVLVAVEMDEEGNVLDGHHRVRACQELACNQTAVHPVNAYLAF